MTKDSLASKLKQTLKKEARVIAAYVIGSTIQGQETMESDFDLVVVVDKKRASDIDKVYDLIREVNFPRDLDLSIVDTSSSPLFLFQIISRGRRIYQRNSIDVMAFEAFTLHNYYDTQHLRDIYRASLKNKFSYAN